MGCVISGSQTGIVQTESVQNKGKNYFDLLKLKTCTIIETRFKCTRKP